MKHFSEFVRDNNAKRTKAYESIRQIYDNMGLEWFFDEFEIDELEKCIIASDKQDCIESGAVVSAISYGLNNLDTTANQS